MDIEIMRLITADHYPHGLSLIKTPLETLNHELKLQL